MAVQRKKIKAGRILAPHKLVGELTLQLDKNVSLKSTSPKSIFIGKDEQTALPYLVVSLKPTMENKFLIKFDEINTREKAAALQGLTVFMTANQVHSVLPELGDDLIGYALVDTKQTPIGVVKAVLEYPGQWLFEFDTPEVKGVLLPANEATVKAFDDELRLITVELPEGLIEIYK